MKAIAEIKDSPQTGMRCHPDMLQSPVAQGESLVALSIEDKGIRPAGLGVPFAPTIAPNISLIGAWAENASRH